MKLDIWSTSRSEYRTAVGLAFCIGTSASAQCTPDWTHPIPAPAPSVRAYHSMVFDSTRDRVMLFGGTTRTTLRSDLWEWNGTAWSLINSVGTAGGRRGMAMSFHDATNRIHLFGGINSLGVVGGTWEWDGTAWTESIVAGPTPRAHSAMVYDAAHGTSVLFGGWGGGLSYFDETWTWDGAAWTRITTAPANTPPARAFHSMAYDSARGRIVLFGGLYNSSSSSQYFADTWEWDGAMWTLMAPPSSPPARAYHAMAFDSRKNQTIMFGGFEFSAGNFNDTWTWDGTTWTHLTTAAAASTRTSPALVFDSFNSNTVLFGGQSSNTYFADTWLLSIPVCCAADFNGDGTVDFFDYLDFVDAFSSSLPTADFNHDGVIDFFDYLDFVDAFSTGC